MFVSDIVKLRGNENTVNLQNAWARKQGKRFQPIKCNMMQLIRTQTKKNNAEYAIEGTVLRIVDTIKCLGVTITED